MFINLEELQPQEAKRLIVEVTGKASGVFLWVCLVVMSLLEGLRDGDSITDLQDRLSLLPSDLEELFSKILDRLNPMYFEQASKLFQLVRASEEPLTLLSHSFVEDGFDKAMAAEVTPITRAEKEYRAERMRRRLNSRCKGLLEAPVRTDESIASAKVQYLHRTVKDFLNRLDIWAYIISGLPPPFDPDLSLFGAALLKIKSISMAKERMPRVRELFGRCFTHAIKFENTNPDLHIKSLEELDRAASKSFEISPHSDDPWDGTWLELFLQLQTSPKQTSPVHWSTVLNLIDGRPGEIILYLFFEYALQYPLYSFTDHGLKTGRSANSLLAGRPALYSAALSADLRLIEMLFNHGADPNFCGGDIEALTPWKHVLELIQETEIHRYPQHRKSSWLPGEEILIAPDIVADIVSIFLENNADPHIVVNGTSVENTIHITFFEWNQERTDELLRKVALLKKTFKDPKKSPFRMKIFFKKLGRHGSKAT